VIIQTIPVIKRYGEYIANNTTHHWFVTVEKETKTPVILDPANEKGYYATRKTMQ